MSTILIVEDHADLAHVMTRLLCSNGLSATSVSGARAALERLETQRPDMMLIDVMMPGMSGIDLLRKMRANPALSQIVVVMYTAMDDPGMKREAMKLGAAEYRVKGTLSGQDLAELVEKHLHRKPRSFAHPSASAAIAS